MFIDARGHPDGGQLDADICIIGAGPAGLAVAHRLMGTGIRTVIVESGGRAEEPDAPDLGGGTSNDPNYPFLHSRARGFGGTTSRWYGASIPLDDSDFASRPWVPHSGWPIMARDLAPHLEAAKALLGIPDLPSPPLTTPLAEGDLAAKPIWISQPLNIGATIGPKVEADAEVHCLLNATVTSLAGTQEGTHVTTAHAASGPGKTLTITARAFVLATGGIENARLLLNSAEIGGLALPRKALGRYHMEHPLLSVGVLRLHVHRAAALPFTNATPHGATRAEHTLGLNAATREKHRLLDLHLRAYRYSPREAHPAIIAAKALANAPSAARAARFLRQHAKDLPGQIAPYAAWHLNNKWRGQARFDHLRLSAFIEVEPRPDNRITLSHQKDRFGMPLPHLHYETTSQARQSLKDTMRLIADDLARRGIGTLRHAPADIAHLRPYDNYGLHQMGSTRMSDDPAKGVVDAQARVHGVNNLFIAGSSVFTTGGAANPTLTIAALSDRLGDELLRHLPTLD